MLARLAAVDLDHLDGGTHYTLGAISFDGLVMILVALVRYTLVVAAVAEDAKSFNLGSLRSC